MPTDTRHGKGGGAERDPMSREYDVFADDQPTADERDCAVLCTGAVSASCYGPAGYAIDARSFSASLAGRASPSFANTMMASRSMSLPSEISPTSAL